MLIISIVVLIFCSTPIVASDAEDFNPADHIVNREEKHAIHHEERCRCTCPSFELPNVAKNQFAQVYTSTEENLKDCSCRNVVLPAIPDLLPENYDVLDQHVCPTCKCTYQRRNLNVIFGVVIFVSVLLSIFAIYVFIYKVIWPKIFASTSYKEQRDDDMVLEDMNEEPTVDIASSTSMPASSSSRFPMINFIFHQNSKWQRDLAQQQRNIYEDHTMLN